MDRAICIALLQSIWDSTDGETFLPYRENGFEDLLKPFDMFLDIDDGCTSNHIPLIEPLELEMFL